MDLNRVIAQTKAIEAALRELGATGRGMHELLESVPVKLPHVVVKRARMVASVRNKLVHHEGYKPLADDAARFEFNASYVLEELKSIKQRLDASKASHKEYESDSANSDAGQGASGTRRPWGQIVGAGLAVLAAAIAAVIAATR